MFKIQRVTRFANHERILPSSAIRLETLRNDRPWPVPRSLNIHADSSSTRRGFIFMKILKRFAQRFAALTRNRPNFITKKVSVNSDDLRQLVDESLPMKACRYHLPKRYVPAQYSPSRS